LPTLDAAAAAALLDDLTAVAARAADAIRNCTGSGAVHRKPDGSPVTAADETAEAVICEALERLAPQLPIISEERAARQTPILPAGKGASYFLVDPLDGTREFIAGRNEYTINIAIMADRAPLLGVICAPALGGIWRGIVGGSADRITGAPNSPPTPIRVRKRPQGETIIMVSRSHLEARTQAYVDGFPQAKLAPSGSAIKFCRVAEGSADLYPRLAPTHDWDVAAGHAIVKAAGGDVAAPDGSPLRYGTPGLLIPGFIATGAVTA